MVICTQPSGSNQANVVSRRAHATRPAMWHLDAGATIPTVGTGFKPYGQRPKERLH